MIAGLALNEEKSILREIGLSTTAIIAITVLGVGFYIYTSYYQNLKLKLDIQLAQKALAGEPVTNKFTVTSK